MQKIVSNNLKYKTYNINSITCLRISLSKTKKISYWASIKNVWVRIAKEYFFYLKSNHLPIIKKKLKSVIFEKTHCEGKTKNGTRCSRWILNKTNSKFCFQHKNKIILDGNDKNNFVGKGFDQFYTSLTNVVICMELYLKYVIINKNQDLIIEPSAGSGAFMNCLNTLCNNLISIDIDPQHDAIQAGNFLEFNLSLNQFKKVHIIGNPPFSLVTKFIKKATKIADFIGFILPLSFLKESRKKVFPLNFHCICQHSLLNTGFHFNNRICRIPTVFQIWEKKDYNRELPVKITSLYIEFVKKEDKPMISFQRVGSKAGKVSTLIENKTISSHYFIKLKGGLSIFDFLTIYKKVKFSHKNTVGPKSISQQELLLELKKYGL